MASQPRPESPQPPQSPEPPRSEPPGSESPLIIDPLGEPESSVSRIEEWGNSPLPPVALATLVAALHFRPLQPLPLAFAPVLLFASYANLQGFRADGAGVAAAASGTYALLSLRSLRRGIGRRRRAQPAYSWRSVARLSARGFVRGAAVGLGLANAIAGVWVYSTADRDAERRERRDNPRWAR
ncbi:hypothetical protein GGS23DRAFT_237422 [Durotheca rogersii]|uniref:uncharacterized protein n=1 Tax=Durotheca rogersii TaxID=419775 RepID=UPI002221289D|nr:uncharacterized protein GGS23DRAFT_237422 [Durotheca rogersii]KAI5860451.1 hypothetical protein GGS23DRAFT_237422 [Durotheca rogersii]